MWHSNDAITSIFSIEARIKMLVTMNVIDCFRRMTTLKSESNSKWCSDFLTYSNFNLFARLRTGIPFSSLIFLLTDTNTPTDLLWISRTYLLTDLLSRIYTYAPIFLFTHSNTHLLVYALNHPHTSLLTNMVNHSITCFSLIYSSTYSPMLRVFTHFPIY